MENDTGMASKTYETDLEREAEELAEGCTSCGLCVAECRFLESRGTPGEIAERLTPSDTGTLLDAYKCSLCGLCGAVCPEGLKPDAFFLAMRRAAVEEGAGPLPEHRGLIAFEKAGFSRWLNWRGLPEGCDTVFMPGCSLPGARPWAVEEIFNLLARKIPGLGIIFDCCAMPSRELGMEDRFRTELGEAERFLREKGIKRIIVACPNCYRVYADHLKDVETVTAWELLADAPPSAGKQGRVAIHDPCPFRREEKPMLAARAMLAASGYEIEEMPHSGITTYCCGEGGNAGAVAPDLSEKWTELRALEAGGSEIACYCSGCAGYLGKKAKASHIADLCLPGSKGKRPVKGSLNKFLKRHLLIRKMKRELKPAHSSRRGGGNGKTARALLFLSILAAAVLFIRHFGLHERLDRDSITAFIDGYGALGPLIYITVYTIGPPLFMPGLPLTIAGGLLFGPLWGVVYTIIGATLGASLSFIVARHFARGWVETRLGTGKLKKLDDAVAENGWKVVAFTRLVPLFPFNLLNYGFGLTRISFTTYAVTSFFTMLPGTAAYVIFSGSLPDLIKGNISPGVIIGGALIVLAALTPLFVRKFSRGKQPLGENRK